MSVLSRSKKAAPRGGSWELCPLTTIHFDDDRVPLTSARADRRDAEAAATAAQLVHERAENARARGADRVAERNRAAVDVHLRLVDAEHADRVERDRCERLVDLEEVD